MKYKISWNSPSQGIQSTEVEALGISQAREQVESMYADVNGFRVNNVSPVFEKKNHTESKESYSSNSSYSSDSSGGGDDFSTIIATMAVLGGAVVALFGLFTLPVGIIAMVLGGGIGWLGMKLAFWMSDRGW